MMPKTPDRKFFERYPYLTDAQYDLLDGMSEISEGRFCASWIVDNEYSFWNAIALSDPGTGNPPMNHRLARRCQTLSAKTGGWIAWVDSPQFVLMAQWLKMLAQHNDASLTLHTTGLDIAP